jgi:hypothetical protein
MASSRSSLRADATIVGVVVVWYDVQVPLEACVVVIGLIDGVGCNVRAIGSCWNGLIREWTRESRCLGRYARATRTRICVVVGDVGEDWGYLRLWCWARSAEGRSCERMAVHG